MKAWFLRSSLFLLFLSCAAAVLLLVFPPSATCQTLAGVYIQGWLSARVRWLYWPVLLALCAVCFLLWRFAERRLAGARMSALAPLAWFPALVMLPHGLASLDPTLAGLVLPLGGTFLITVVLERAIRPSLDNSSASTRQSSRAGWILFAITTVFLLSVWGGFTHPQGFGSGDVKHYLIQLENLLERGDLDLTDRVNAMMDAWRVPSDSREEFLLRSHMKVNAAGRIHSYHSFGFPLLAWPFRAILGTPMGDGILLALLGAFALCGVRAACLAHGAPRAAADVATALTGLSYVWVFTALSFLPEMLGFGLVAWAFWAVAAQRSVIPQRRWLAAAVAAAACVYLPMAHIRFTPTAGMLAACFGVEGLCLRNEPFWRRKVPRLTAFSLACFAGWVVLLASRMTMYRGTATYDYVHIAGSVPAVMWAMFSDRRGIVSVLPAASAFLVSAAVAAFRRDEYSRGAFMALSVVAATLWFCCCTPVALGGACINGRYFYPAIPVLLPFFAISLVRAARPGRLWLLFLSLLPVTYFLFLTWMFSGTGLIYAPTPARYLLNLALLWEPFPSFYNQTPSSAYAAGHLFSAILFALSLLACTRFGSRTVRTALAVILLPVAFFCGRAVDRAFPSGRISVFNVLMEGRHFTDFRVLDATPTDIFSAYIPSSGRTAPIYILTDTPDDDSSPKVCRLQHPCDLAVDDWRGRSLRWGKVHHTFVSFQGQCGAIAARARGRVVRGTAHLALQIEGIPDAPDVMLREGPFDVVFRGNIKQPNKGANFRVSLEDDVGEVVIDAAEFVPNPSVLLPQLGGFPASSRIVEWKVPPLPGER